MNTKKKQKHLYRIQLGFFNLEENARALQAQLLFFGIRCCDRTWRGWDLPGLQWIF